jgi:nitrite reductase (NADH) large subunit
VIALLALIAHTGLRLGNHINFYLMAAILGISIIGVMASAVISIQHRLDYVRAQQVREKSLWIHILLLWPLPVLLGFHIFKTYYY